MEPWQGKLKSFDVASLHVDWWQVGWCFFFVSNAAGGNETAILSVLSALLIHGMLVKGMAEGSHYGPVAIKSFDDRAEKECRSYANQLADILKD